MSDNNEQSSDKSLSAQWKLLLEEHRQETNKISYRIQEAEQIQAEWKQIQDNSAKRFADLDMDPVELNVGGEIFTTAKSSIAQCPHSLLYAMLATDVWQPDDNGEYFFDRDPEYFGVVLDFVRDGKRRNGGLDAKLLDKEFEFFGLNEINVPAEPGPLALIDAPKASDFQACQQRFTGLFNSNKKMLELYRSTFTGEVLKSETMMAHWRSMEERLRTLASDAKTKIIFKVGGPKFCTTPTTIKGSEMLSSYASRWPRNKKEGFYFIDKNGRIFGFILRFLRLGVWHTQTASAEDLEDIVALAKYLLIPEDLLPPDLLPSSFGSISPLLQHFPPAWLSGKKLLLIYKGSRDGWTVADFHRCCDNRGPTLTVVKSTSGYIFGGYASVAWNSSVRLACPSRKILNRQSPDIWQLQCALLNSVSCMYSNAEYGPTFGGGHDLYISGNCYQNSNSFSNLGHSYQAPTGMDSNALAGQRNFQVTDLEVFSVQ